jgi:ribosomal protein L31
MKYYIECFDLKGQQILGNLDGQAVIRANSYKRTDSYKRIVQIVRESHPSYRTKWARIVDEEGRVLEVIE